MAIIVTMAPGAPSSSGIGNQTMNYTVTVQNTGTAAVTLTSLSVAPANASPVRVSQPNYLTPNVTVGVGNPTISAASSVTYGFQAIYAAPVMPGPSPQAPGGAAPINSANYPQSVYTLQATSQTSDGTVASGIIVAPVLSATFPQSNGGALVMSQGFNLVNLVTL